MNSIPLGLAVASLLTGPLFAQSERHLTLDGSGDHVRVTDLVGLADVDAFTVEGWMRSTGGNHADKLFDLGQDPNYRWTIQATCTVPSNWDMGYEDGVGDVQLFSEGTPCDGAWHHFALVDDGLTARSFIDGELTASAPSTGTLWQMDGKVLSIGDHVVLGADPWDGDLDELRVWRRALGAEEVAEAASWSLPSDASGLVSWWTFDEDASDAMGLNDGAFGGDAALALSVDCDQDGVPDSVEIQTGAHSDCDGNGVPDVCELAPWKAFDFEGEMPAGLQLGQNAVWMDGAVRLNGAPEFHSQADSGSLSLEEPYAWQPETGQALRADFRIKLEGGYDIQSLQFNTPGAHTATSDDWFQIQLEFDHYFNGDQGAEAEPNGNHLSLRIDKQVDGVFSREWLGHFSPSFSLPGSGWLDVAVLVDGERFSAWIGPEGAELEQAFADVAVPGTWQAPTTLRWGAWNGSGPGGNEHWVDDIALSVGGCGTMIVTSVTPRGAWSHDRMLVQGVGFDGSETVMVGGVEYPLLNWRPDELEVGVPPIAPGLQDVVVTQGDALAGATATLWPVLGVVSTGLGGTADVTIDFSGPGLHLFAISNGATEPLALPNIHHGLELAQTPVLQIMATGFSGGEGIAAWQFPIPSNPGLAGATIEVQAWSQEGLFQFVTSSFSNRVTVEL